MKILHINCNYIGTTLHQAMIEKMDALEIENQVYVPTYDKDIAVLNVNHNVCVDECFKKWDRIFFDYKQYEIMKSIQHKINIQKYDCIHAYTLFTDGNCAMHLSEKYGIPYVVAVRNTDVNAFFAHMIHLRGRGIQIMLKASAVFFLSESYRDQVFKKYIPSKYQKCLLEKTYIIPNGIDSFWLENKAEKKEYPEKEKRKINLIYAGRIDKNKNIPMIQRAMDVLKNRNYDVHLTVVGRAVDKKELEKIQRNSFTSYYAEVNKEKLLQMYREHDIFVMPSFTESFGLVYAEAMSQGLPVIYSKGQGFDRQFREGEVGYHVESNSPDQLAEVIIKIIAEYPRISENARRCVNKFSWDKIVPFYEEIYQKVVKQERI